MQIVSPDPAFHRVCRGAPRYAALVLGCLFALTSGQRAQAQAAQSGAPAAPTPPPYSLPWQLRPAAAATVLRSDTAFAFYKDPMTDESGMSVPSFLLGSYKVTPEFAPMMRVGAIHNSPPEVMGKSVSGFVLTNPLFGGTYVFKLSPELRLAAFFGFTLPVGGGGGNMPKASSATARNSGLLARSAMDNAMFAVNDFTIIPGLDLAYVAHGFTAQLEATLLQLTRARGDVAQKDASRTNFTAGLHLGYFFIPQLSLGAELRYQRWLSTPANVKMDMTGTLRDTLSMAVGLRVHIKAGSTWFRPGVAYAQGLDAPMTKSKYHIVQLDVPVQF